MSAKAPLTAECMVLGWGGAGAQRGPERGLKSSRRDGRCPDQGVVTEREGWAGALGSQIPSGHEGGGVGGEVQESHWWGHTHTC